MGLDRVWTSRFASRFQKKASRDKDKALRDKEIIPYNQSFTRRIQRTLLQLDFLGDLRRTHMCGELRAEHAGQRVVLLGWVNRRRDLGNVIFIDVRDRSGMTQLVFDKGENPAVHEKASGLRSEYVIAAIGKVCKRDADTVNPGIPTGEIEITVDELKLLNESKHPPFLPGDNDVANEEVRLKYRYIDFPLDKKPQHIQPPHNSPLAIRHSTSYPSF